MVISGALHARIFKMFRNSIFSDTILRRNATTFHTFKITFQNLVLIWSNSRGRGLYPGRYVPIFSKCFKLPFLFYAIFCQNAPTRDIFEITSHNLVLFFERFSRVISKAQCAYFFKMLELAIGILLQTGSALSYL